jgi:magnesium transporter
VIVDQAIYRGGRREPCGDLSDALEALRADSAPQDFLWIGLKDPTQAEFALVNEELKLHPLAVEDAV